MAITISGNGITSANIADGTITNADVNDVAASKLTGSLPAIDGSALTGISGGKVLQVVSSAVTYEYTSTSSTYADAFSATITPTATTSKILVLLSLNSCSAWLNNTMLEVKLLRDSTTLGYPASNAADTDNTNRNSIGSISISYLDSPSTTSAITYKTQYRSAKGGSYARINEYYYVPSTSTITLMEIGA